MDIFRQPGCTRTADDPVCGVPNKNGWSCCGRGTDAQKLQREYEKDVADYGKDGWGE